MEQRLDSRHDALPGGEGQHVRGEKTEIGLHEPIFPGGIPGAVDTGRRGQGVEDARVGHSRKADRLGFAP